MNSDVFNELEIEKLVKEMLHSEEEDKRVEAAMELLKVIPPVEGIIKVEDE